MYTMLQYTQNDTLQYNQNNKKISNVFIHHGGIFSNNIISPIYSKPYITLIYYHTPTNIKYILMK